MVDAQDELIVTCAKWLARQEHITSLVLCCKLSVLQMFNHENVHSKTVILNINFELLNVPAHMLNAHEL